MNMALWSWTGTLSSLMMAGVSVGRWGVGIRLSTGTEISLAPGGRPWKAGSWENSVLWIMNMAVMLILRKNVLTFNAFNAVCTLHIAQAQGKFLSSPES